MMWRWNMVRLLRDVRVEYGEVTSWCEGNIW